MLELTLGITFFTILIIGLTGMILLVRSRLFKSNEVTITINSEKTLVVLDGRKLLDSLSDIGLLLPSACGGRGTCGQCRLIINSGAGSILPTEKSLLNEEDLADHVRLACQVIVRQDLDIIVPAEIYGVEKWLCTLVKSANVSTFIRELVLELPKGDELVFRAGSFVMVECPPYEASFRDFEIDKDYCNEWTRFDMWRYKVKSTQTVSRAYSLANFPEENSIAILNVRIAIPPPGSNPSTPPGLASSYLFSLKPGDQLTLYGPYGDFFAKDTQKEMVFIGGGAGMAPMRSHIFDQLLRIKATRKISFWYGARNRKELFYEDFFTRLEAGHPNFHWFVALSDPTPEDRWTGAVGFIHNVVYDNYLANHPAPELCEYYVCGPPLMNSAVIKMLEDLGVERQDIVLDDFGA
jgi:Na+-transporting NADH:ubiquinone oxidoreductase subunit F